MGAAAIQNIGILPVNSDVNSAAGLYPGQFQMSVSFNRTSIHIKKMNSREVRQNAQIESATISTGVGLTNRISLWGQIPAYKSQNSDLWKAGDFGVGLKWNPSLKIFNDGSYVFINEGLIIPVNEELGQTDAGFGKPLQGRLLSRTVVEFWKRSELKRTFGIQALMDLSVSETNADAIFHNSVYQITSYALDHRFSQVKITPYVAMIYRYDSLNRQNYSAGWFIQIIGSIDYQINDQYAITIAGGGPVVIGIDGTDLSQTNVSLSIRWISKE